MTKTRKSSVASESTRAVPSALSGLTGELMTTPDKTPLQHRRDKAVEKMDIEETLNTRERVLGPEHPDTLFSCNNLASGYHTLGR